MPSRPAPPPRPAPAATPRRGRERPKRRFRLVRTLVRTAVFVVLGYLALCTALLLSYNVVQPPATVVQAQRAVEALVRADVPAFAYSPVGADEMGAAVRRAAVASEDSRFYQHFGFDLVELRAAREQAARRGRPMRGASTITQQLVKNLFLTTHRSFIRKGFEVPLTLIAELVLPKERILTLYLNVAEWGPGVYGIEEAARYHYGRSASALSRNQAARLVACLPNPLDRRPQNMGRTASAIERRMRQMGW